MPRNFSKYQYETSPRKLEPEYTPPKNPYKSKRATTAKPQTNKKKNQNKQVKDLKNQKAKMIMYVIIGFAIMFAISYRNSQIDESFAKVQNLKEELSEVEKENTQLKISIENNSNIANLEQQAKELLGMQKLTNKQTVYVNLPKTDHIESAAEEVVIDNNDSIISKVTNAINQLFK